MAAKAVKVGNIWGGAYRAVQTTAADGTATFTFPKGLFAAAPIVVATGVSTDGRDVAVSLVGDPAADKVQVQARKSRTLPLLNLLTSLAGFDVYAPVAAKVHIIAWAPT